MTPPVYNDPAGYFRETSDSTKKECEIKPWRAVIPY